MKCSKCGSRDIDFQESIGQSICVNCGTVLEENTIVSSIEFQESGDRSNVVGQFISASCSKPYSGGRPMGGHGDSRDPRDATLVNARRTITQVASNLRLPPLYIDRAFRLYQLALQRNFIFGRKQLHVVATCLYIICRQEKSPHLLIDFSDALQVNVYVLGKAFLQFSKVLNLNLPVVDPSLYIHRYAIRLDLGESRASVVATALRIITRLKKDWIATGRRPDGICALAMMVSARAHDFEVNQDVICKLFRVSPDLLRRRIDDFRSIPSAQLTLEQFHTHDAEVEYDPPAFIRNVVRDNATAQAKAEAAAAADPTMVDRHQRSHKVRLALPSADPKKGNEAGGTVSALVAAAAMTLPGAQNSDSDEEGREGGEGDVMKDSDNLISDPVYQTAGSKNNDDSEEDEESPSQRSSSWNGRSGEQESFFKTKIADIDIVVPIPGQRKRRRTTDHALLKIQQRKDLYEDVYQQVLEDCRGSATGATDELDEKLEALQREAQTIEDATDGVGGWGEHSRQLSRIKERRIVLCVDNASAATASAGKAAASSSSSSSAGKAGVLTGKIKFRKLNNGADASMVAVATKTEASTGTAAATTTTEGVSAEGSEVEQEDMLGEELGRYLLTEEEQQKRTLIWEKTYGPFMKEREERRKAREREQQSSGASEKYTQNGKLRRRYTRKALAAAAAGGGAATTSQAVLQAQQTRSSKKINYDALKGVFSEDGSFAAPSAPAVPADNPAAVVPALERGSHQAYLDSLMGLSIPGLSDPAAPILGPLGGAASGAAGGFQKDVRNTLLGSSIAKTSQSQRGAPQKGKELGGNLLTAGTALSRGAGMGRGGKLGPALDGAPATSRTATTASKAPTPAPPVPAPAAVTEELVEDDGEEEDQLLYEGGGGEDGDYDDYDDEYY